MRDPIERQAAIDSVHSSVKFWDDGDVNYLIELIVACLQELPSAEKHGHWIESDTDGFVCSECRNGYRDQPTMMGKPMFEYCPVCGAKMKEVAFDELKTEADKLGYRLIKKQTPIKLLPCTCGRKRIDEWFDTGYGVRDKYFYVCPQCRKKSPQAKTIHEARIAWNKMIEEERGEDETND